MRYYLHESRKAIWSQRIALICLLVFVANFAMHRFWGLPTPLAMKAFGVSVAGAVAGLVLGMTAFANIWREGYIGAGRATVGALVSALILAVPLWSLPSLLTLPRLNDVSTDVENPPAFQRIAAVRRGPANAPDYPVTLASLQTSAYPDIQPVTLARPNEEVFSAVREVAKNLDWRIVSDVPPQDGKAGVIEAVHRDFFFGFTDDVVIRVSAADDATRVDVRSASRYGQHDLGRNASRIREFYAGVSTRLAQIEQAERMARVMAEKEKLAREKARADERAARQRRANANRSRSSSSSERTRYEGSADRESRQSPSRARTRAERRRTRRQRQRERTRAARKFWEQLGR